MFLQAEQGDMSTQVVSHFVDTLKDRIDKVKSNDFELKKFATEQKKKIRKKRSVIADSDLTDFMN